MNYKALDEDIICGEDGFWVWWPTAPNRGAMNSQTLQLVAYILDELNIEVDGWYDDDDIDHCNHMHYPNCDDFGCYEK